MSSTDDNAMIGTDSSKPTLVAIKGTVFDVSRNPAYAPSGTYHGISSHVLPAPHIFPLPFPPLRSVAPGAPTLPLHFALSAHQLHPATNARAVFAGKDPSRALAISSLKPVDCVPEWSDLEDSSKTVLDEWMTFFSKRYNIVGKVLGAYNL
jgi:hypothetical protein